jgi:hypothetical protein
MADNIFAATAPVTPQADADTHSWGMRFTVGAASTCVGGRAWVNVRPTTFFWQLWNQDTGVRIAQVDLNTLPAPTPNTWMTFTSADFQTPGDVALAAGTTYIVNVFFQTGDGFFTNPGAFTIGNGVVPSVTNVTSDSGIFNNTLGQNAIPATAFGAYFFADLEANLAATTVTGTLNLTIPALEFDSAAQATVAGTLNLNVPALEADDVGLVNVAGTLNLTIPALEFDADGQLPVTGTLNLTIPAIEADFDAVSAAGGATVGPCGWTIPDPLCCSTEWAALDPAVQSSARDYAALILWAATGRQFGLCEVTVRPCGMKRCADGMYDFFGWDWSGNTWVPYIFTGICSCDPRCQVRLMGPVDSIVEVLLDGIAVDPATYRVDDNHWLVRTAGQCWPFCVDMNEDTGPGTFEVTYARGTTPPPALLRAASTLACEWGKACVGNECRLSNRVTSIARQGVSIEMASPEAFLEDGLTGLWEVDSIIKALNPYSRKQRGRIYAPELNVPRMTTSP